MANLCGVRAEKKKITFNSVCVDGVGETEIAAWWGRG